jgi:hypothetical protein
MYPRQQKFWGLADQRYIENLRIIILNINQLRPRIWGLFYWKFCFAVEKKDSRGCNNPKLKFCSQKWIAEFLLIFKSVRQFSRFVFLKNRLLVYLSAFSKKLWNSENIRLFKGIRRFGTFVA